MKRIIIFFTITAFISCNGGTGAGSTIEKTDSAKAGKVTGPNATGKKIDSAAAALPTDTALYKRKPNDSVVRKPQQ